MTVKLYNEKIQSAFSRSAPRYDALADLQQGIGRRLLQRIPVDENYEYVLDVGMGTGLLTDRLAQMFPSAFVSGIDFADGMVACANRTYDNFHILQADAAALPFKEGVFDLIVSNLAYQWVEDLPRAFAQGHSILKEKGTFCAAMFGQDSLPELFESLENSFPCNSEGKPFEVKRLPALAAVSKAVSCAGFEKIDITNETIKVHFDDMLDLVKWLKGIGANAIRRNRYVGKNRLSRANEYYKERFPEGDGVYASLEVIWINAQKLL